MEHPTKMAQAIAETTTQRHNTNHQVTVAGAAASDADMQHRPQRGLAELQAAAACKGSWRRRAWQGSSCHTSPKTAPTTE